MSARKYRLTSLADADIRDVLAHTFQKFGERQFEVYWQLIDEAARMIGEDPLRPSSKRREELGSGVRSFHLEVAAGRKGAASHILYYIAAPLDDGREGAVILRVLWEGMEPSPLVALGRKEI
jgi:toxin ParE1/3/4